MASIEYTSKLYQSNLSLVTTLDLANLWQIQAIRTLEDVIKRLIVENVLTQLERGKYFITSKRPSTFEIANFIYSPSYVSFETALNFHGILSQFPVEITSASPVKKAEKLIDGKLFTYSKIDKKLYTGYYKESGYLIATKEKALFDELYLISKSIKSETVLEDLDLLFVDKAKLTAYINLLPKNLQKTQFDLIEKYL